MKIIATKLDNGYTLTIEGPDRMPLPPEAGVNVEAPLRKQRLVFENKEDLIDCITEVM